MNAQEALECLKSGKGVQSETHQRIEMYWTGSRVEFERDDDPHVSLDEHEFLIDFENATFHELEQ